MPVRCAGFDRHDRVAHPSHSRRFATGSLAPSETIRHGRPGTPGETIQHDAAAAPGLAGALRLKYPRAHNDAMHMFGPLRYTPPAPPHETSITVNRARATPPALEWKLSRAAQLRLTFSPTAPHSDLIAVWSCPVCETAVPRFRRAGRHRVYCTNACRQQAYRRRCVARNAQPMAAHRDPRPIRATTRDRVHAVREFRDVSSGRRDSIRRGVTACGAFRENGHRHTGALRPHPFRCHRGRAQHDDVSTLSAVGGIGHRGTDPRAPALSGTGGVTQSVWSLTSVPRYSSMTFGSFRSSAPVPV